MKEWLSAREIAAEALPYMPATKKGLNVLIEREFWDEHPSFARNRAGRGGGMEYHFRMLPTLAQIAYVQKYMVVAAPELECVIEAATTGKDGKTLSAQGLKERDARLAILAAYDRFTRGLNLGHATRVQVFTDKYNVGSIKVDDWVRETVPKLSKRSLIRWRSARRDGKTIAVDRGQSRRGTSVLEIANEGRVTSFILGLIAHRPHLSGRHVRDLCRSEFGDTLTVISKSVETTVKMPPVRTFQHSLKRLKAEHKVELLKLTNPDLYRSTMAPSGIGTLRHITEPNQLWQVDASPWDGLCVDGRWSVYACIDIATRRMVLLLSRTPRASAVALLIRKAVMTWGVPAVIKTDNGSDFVAYDTKRLFASLGIEMVVSDAYQPQQKGHIERAIGTFQRDAATLLPGFIGHSVTDRKAIEGRKSFAARLGESDTNIFGVELTGPQLQEHVDQWAAVVYQNTPHAGLNGKRPFEAALASTTPIRTVDERALDLLLMPVAGTRTVTKFGVRVGGNQYMTPNVLPTTIVSVRQDPADLGRAYLFSEDGAAFLGEARCPELSGFSTKDIADAKQAARDEVTERIKPIRKEMQRIAEGRSLADRRLEVASRDAPNVIALPKREETHSTAQIEAAILAMGERVNPSRELTAEEQAEQRRMIEEMDAEEAAHLIPRTNAMVEQRLAEREAARIAHLPEGVVALPETPKARYARALEMQKAVSTGARSGDMIDGVWLAGYVQTAEFKALAKLHAEYGEEYLS